MAKSKAAKVPPAKTKDKYNGVGPGYPEHIRKNLSELPNKPGCYLHRDKMGQIIYVGKAASLRNRVRQYFQSKKNMDAKVRAMVGQIADFEYIVCGSEMEAFILENNLIKKHRPKYNILLRDDKTYPYVKVTTNETWPRLVKTRVVGKDKAKYFGPYSDVTAVNDMIRLLNDVFVLKRCSATSFKKGWRPCLNYHIGKCEGICTGKVDHDAYMGRVEKALAYFAGKDKSVESYLTRLMKESSANMEYEQAAIYRDHLQAAKALRAGQRVVLKNDVDVDAVLTIGPSHMAIFFVRDGKLSGHEVFAMQTGEGDTEEQRTGAFLRQYYSGMTSGPAEILVADPPEEAELIEEYLSDLWNRKTKITRPVRGEKKALLELAMSNRDTMLKNMEGREERIKTREENLRRLLDHLFAKMDGTDTVLGEGKAPVAGEGKAITPDEDKPKAALTACGQHQKYRVEAYDISNTNGIDTVAAMVVFRGLKPDKRAYRKFKIRSEVVGDDYAAMQEVLYRRFKRAQEGDFGFAELPDLLVIDGGKGHIHAAQQILRVMKIDIPMVGAVKDDGHRTRGLVYFRGDAEEFGEIDLKEEPLLFSYIGTIQEEVHRFAIEYHRKIRDSKALVSVLDEIEGIGPKKRNALLTWFGGIESIKQAAKLELVEVPGITEKNAKAILAFFAKGRTSPDK